jgi:hypothetical protein
MKPGTQTQAVPYPHYRDVLAAFLSIVPGLGHVYKGHYLLGFGILFVGTPLFLFGSGLLALATFGLGLFLPPAAWVVVAMHAYLEPDVRRHHFFH